MTNSFEFVHTHIEGHIGFLEIDRPPVNAYNFQTHREIHEALQSMGGDAELRCVVLSAAGVNEGRPFGAGSDIKEFVSLDPRTSLERARSMRGSLVYVSLPRPDSSGRRECRLRFGICVVSASGHPRDINYDVAGYARNSRSGRSAEARN